MPEKQMLCKNLKILINNKETSSKMCMRPYPVHD